jgi:hypothetical protein
VSYNVKHVIQSSPLSPMIDEQDDFEVPYLFMADAAEAVGGKLYVLGGGWDRMILPVIPGRAAKPFAVALGIKVPYSHTNRKFELMLELIDSDGNTVGEQAHLGLESGRPPGLKPGTPQSVPIALAWHPEFPAEGRYAIVARIDGAIKNTVSFEIMSMQMPFMPGGPLPGPAGES